MSAEHAFIEEVDTTPSAWQKVISMKKYLPVLVLSSSACNLVSSPDSLQSTLFSGYFFGHTSDLVFWGGLRDKNRRALLGMGTAALGGAITFAISGKYGVPAGGLLAFGEGVLSMGLTMMYGIMKIQEKVEEIRGGE